MRKPVAGLLLVLAIAAVIALQTQRPSVVEAHAVLVRADPPANSQLREPRSVMTLYFSEPVERKVSTIQVVDSDKQRVDTGVEFDDQDDALMRVNLGQMKPGYYSVNWSTLSRVDGHRISGSYPITVLNPDGTTPPGTAPSAQAATVSGTNAKPDRAIARWALLLAGSVATGAIAFAWVIGVLGGDHAQARDAAVNRLVAAAAIGLLVLAVAGFIDLLLQADAVFGSIVDFPKVIADTRWGQRWILRNLLVPPMAVGLVAFYRRKLDSPLSGYILGLLLALAFGYLAVTSMVSHAAAGRGSVWATASDFVHLVAASVWIGMLLQVVLLARWLRRSLPRNARPIVLSAALRRFSLVAVGSVSLVLFTGVVNSAIELNRLSDLLNTGYGQALLIKLILVVPLLLAGGFNAYLFRPQVVEEAERAQTGRRGGVSGGWDELEATLSRTVRIEAGLAVAVLLVVGVLTQIAPSRSALGSPDVAGKFTQSKDAGDVTVTLVVDPNQPGQNAFEVYLTGNATTVERVRLLFDQEKKGAFQSDLILNQSNTPLIYVGGGAFLNEEGKWRITVDLRRTEGSDTAVAFEVEVIPPGGATAASRGGAFEAPRSFSMAAIALMAASGALSLALAFASLDKPGRPAGLMGDWADRLADVQVRPGVSLAALVLVGIGLGILVGTHGHELLTGEKAREGNPVESSPASIERGRMLFIQNCIQCHGESGRGDGPLALSLRIPPANLYDHVPYHPDQFFFNVISNGLTGVMPAFSSQISEEDRWNILNFLRDQFGEGAVTQ